MTAPNKWLALLVRIKRLLPDSDHPAASQPTPFGLNRYLLLLIYVFYTLSTSCVYFGWRPLGAMLFKAGAFLWQCSEEDQRAGSEGGPACVFQDIKVQSLFTLCYASHFTMSAAAGFLIDAAGPKVTAMLGQALNICGWAILGACTDTFRAVTPAIMLIGAGADMCYLPMLCIINLFPGSTGFALTIMGASCSLSFAVPSILKVAYDSGISFKWVCWSYAIMGPAVCMILVILFVPLNGFIEVDLFVLVRSVPSRHTSTRFRSIQQQRGGSLYTPQTSATPIEDLTQAGGAALSSVTDDDFFQPFKKEACTFLYIAVCVYFVFCSIAMNYYQQAAAKFLVNGAASALEAATPLSTFPCLILGRLADFVPIVPLMFFVNTTGALSYLLVLVNNPVLDYISIASFSIYISVLTSQVYIFIKNLFTSVHFGKLIGIATMVGGVLSLISNALYDGLTMRQFKGDATRVMWGLFATICAVYLLLIPMFFAARKKQREINSHKVMRADVGIIPRPASKISIPPYLPPSERVGSLIRSVHSRHECVPQRLNTPHNEDFTCFGPQARPSHEASLRSGQLRS